MLLAFTALATAFDGYFELRARPVFVEMFRDMGDHLSTGVRLALSPWFLRAAMGSAAALVVGGIALPLRRSRRTALFAAAVTVASCAGIFATLTVYARLFELAASVAP